MGATYEEMLNTPWHVIAADLEMINLEDRYKEQQQQLPPGVS